MDTVTIKINKEIKKVAQEEKFNAKTAREIRQTLKEIKQGKGLSPGFDNAEDAINYLKSL